jgi:TPR repeat protein
MSGAILRLCLLISSAATALGTEITGKVTEVSGDTVTIAPENTKARARAGDSVAIYFQIPGLDDLAKVGSGRVVGVKGDRIVARIDQRTGSLAVGQIAKIQATGPPAGARVATPGPQKARPRSAEPRPTSRASPGAAETPPLCEPGECATLGLRYETGSGVAQDFTRAIEYYRAGCKARVVKSCGHLGSILMLRGTTEREYTEAIAPLRVACDSGYPIACSNLGTAYALGRGGLPKDDRHALALFVKACDMENAIACTLAGITYIAGTGIPRDTARAFEYLHKGCRLGDDKACQDMKSQ